MTDIRAIRATINDEMRRKGISRRGLSMAAGLSESAVRDLLSRTTNPGFETLRKIAEALDLPTDALTSDQCHAIPKMPDTRELLARLRAVGARNVDVARTLGLPDSRVPEIYSGKRALKLDEAVKLVEDYGLDPAPHKNVSRGIARLAVLHILDAADVEASTDDPLVDRIASDLLAICDFVARPGTAGSLEAVEGFSHGLRVMRSPPRVRN